MGGATRHHTSLFPQAPDALAIKVPGTGNDMVGAWNPTPAPRFGSKGGSGPRSGNLKRLKSDWNLKIGRFALVRRNDCVTLTSRWSIGSWKLETGKSDMAGLRIVHQPLGHILRLNAGDRHGRGKKKMSVKKSNNVNFSSGKLFPPRQTPTLRI